MSDWIEKLKNQEVYGGGDREGDLWGTLGAGGYSALDEVLMGLPSFLVKNVGGKETWNKLDQFRKDNKLASDIGGGLGFIGSMLVPGGAIAKGAGKLAKFAKLGKLAGVLDKAGDVAKLSTKGLKGLDALKVGAKAGAVQALEQAIPRAITGLDREDLPGSAMKGLQNIGTGALFGGATGATLGRVFDKIAPHAQQKIDDFGEMANKISLASAGTNKKLMKKYMIGKANPGKALQSLDDKIKEAGNIVRQKGLKYEANVPGFLQEIDDTWSAISRNYDEALPAFKAVNPEEVLQNPRVADLLDVYAGSDDEIQKAVTGYLNKVNKLKTSGEKRAFLGKIFESVQGSPEPNDKMRGQVALAIKDAIKDKVQALSDAPKEVIDKANKLFPMEEMIKEGLNNKKIDMTNPAKGGSDTVGKLLGQSLAGGALGVGMTGGGDITDPEVLQKKLAAGLIGVGLGGMTNRLATGAVSNLLEKSGNLIGNKLPIAEIVGKAVPGLGGKLAGAIPSKLGQEEPGTVGGEDSGGAAPDDAKASVMQTEAAADPVAKEETKAEFTDAYKDTIKRQLLDTFTRYYQNNPDFPGLTFDQFAVMAKKKTENFDPVKSSKLLFPDNPEMEAAYLKKYETMLYLKNLDAEKALSKDPGILGFGGGYEDEANYQKVRDLMVNIASGGKIENMDSASMLKMVDEDLGRAMKAKGAKKAALMDLLTRKYGLDFSDLASMGVL